jgi:hypothetical protein
MSTENIINDAAAAAASPANDAPDAREAERISVTKSLIDPALPPHERAAKLDQLRRITSDPDALAREDAQRVEREAKVPASEKRRQEITRRLISDDLKKDERERLTRELRELVASQDTPEERERLVESGIKGARQLYNLAPPPEVPAFQLQQYEEEYSGHEQDLLLWSRSEGLAANTVKDLRDYGVKLGVSLEGKRMSDDDVKEFKTKFASRLTPSQSDLLLRWWRTEVEGGAS